ncbi:hypothetical protein Ahp1_11 [Aeromonas phage Ahp1]|uniref:Uncharacterized protein n=1 Tax=Aeromonas phage Ahp1 TaxID=1747286 RepID=A0A1S5Q8D0_9CAUD|nr:hypothetical protein HOS19_gp11 [Aeromonas phage Ahp1]ALP47730.1 hypothetical protein Ahp1_11 [Aeromonas phage Ahp1]
MSTGTALVNARTPNLKPEDQKGHGSVTYLSPEEQHAAALAAAALRPDHELDCQLQPKNQQPGAKRRIVAKPAALGAQFGDPAAQAIAILIHNLDSGYAFLRHLDVITKEALLDALADDLGLSIE